MVEVSLLLLVVTLVVLEVVMVVHLKLKVWEYQGHMAPQKDEALLSTCKG